MRFLTDLRERLRAFFWRRTEERELADELAFHLDRQIEENIKLGMSPHEARRQASIKLGGVERIKEDVRDARGTRPIEDITRDIRFGIRRLFKERSFTIPAVANIALGVGVTTAVFAMAHAILIRPLPYPDSHELVEVGHTSNRTELAVTGLSPGTFLHYRDQNRSFAAIAVYMEYGSTVTDDAESPEQVRVAMVSHDMFTVLRVVPFLGSLPSRNTLGSGHRNGVLIGYDLWVRRYGADSSIIGNAIEIAREEVVVAGIAQPGFHFPRPDTQVWITGRMDELLDRFGARAAVGGLFLNGVGRLAHNASLETAVRDLNRAMRALPDAFADVTAQDLDEMGLAVEVTPLKHTIVSDVRAALLLLSGTAAFLLLITWANATNLCLVRTARLTREIALERALGASSGRVIQRFWSESFLLVLGGGLLGFAIARAAIALRFGFDTSLIPRLNEMRVDGSVIALAIGLSLLTAALIATVMSLGTRNQRRSGQQMSQLYSVRSTHHNQTGRQILVAGQIGLALVLLIGSALMARSYQRLATVDLGFRSDNALTFFLPLPANPYTDRSASARLHDELTGRLRDIPGVTAVDVATTAAFPLTPVPDHYNDRVTTADNVAGDSTLAPRALFSFATPGYFETMGIPIVSGRTFENISRGTVPEVILSTALARDLFGNDNPIDRRVRSFSTGTGEYRVVGVVGNVPSRSIREGGANVIYFGNVYPLPAYGDEAAAQTVALRDEQYVVRTNLPPASVLSETRQIVADVDPKLVMSGVSTLDDVVASSLARPRVTTLLLLVAATTALILGLIGIYGVLSYTVGQRTKELGVRVALGETPTGVVRMVVRQGAVLAMVGIAAGLVVALGLMRYLDSLLYEVTPNDPTTFVGTAGLLLGVSLAASYIPARRAGKVDPVTALRSE